MGLNRPAPAFGPFKHHLRRAAQAPRGPRRRRSADEAISGLAVVAAIDQGRRSLRNFSRKRPETTNLNHQKAIRRVFIGSTLAG